MPVNPVSTRNLVPAEKGGKSGRKPGSPNRSTIARKVLSSSIVLPEKIYEALLQEFPGIKRKQTIEFAATLMQAYKAIVNKDTNAYKAIMDSAYGSPIQQVEDLREKEPITIEIVDSRTNES